ncbi:unnamed protein product [Calypogeia fissa]
MTSALPPEKGEKPPTEANVVIPGMKQELENLNNLLDSSSIEEDLQELAMVQARGTQTLLFLDEDDEFQKVLAQALLTRFFEQICKVDGTLYPTETLMSLYRSFHRIIRKRQEARIQNTGVEEVKLSLKESAMFKSVGVACVLAMHKSRDAGANLPCKKSAVISMEDEQIILRDACTMPTNSQGLQKRVAYYLLNRFCIWGGSELYSLPSEDFSFGADATGKFVRFDERMSKNCKVSMERFQDEHFQPPIVEYDVDVVETIQKLIKHLPVSVTSPVKYMFYQAIDNPRSIAWYSTSCVAERNLNEWVKLMYEESGLISDGITNKSGRTTCVTRMAVGGVPPVVGMLLSGHQSQGAYACFDRSIEAQVRAAQKAVSNGAAFYATVKEENAKLKCRVVQGKKKARIETDPTFEGIYVGDEEESLVMNDGANREDRQAKKPYAKEKGISYAE